MVPTESIFANHKVCDICDENVDTKKYYRIDFHLYVTAANLDTVLAFLAKVESDISTYNIKEVAVSPIHRPVNDDASLYEVIGSVTFVADLDGSRVYNELKDLSTANSKKIVYGYIYLLENSHHYPDPEPDNVILFIEINRPSNLDKYNLDDI
jgi:hypothetical protein